MKDVKLTFIGAGNIGGATAVGVVKSGAVAPDRITVTATHSSSLEKFKPLGIHTTTDNIEAVRGADLVLIAVKPLMVEKVLKQIKDALDYGSQMLVSMAPGIKPEQLRGWLDKNGTLPRIAYLIPNTAIEIGRSMTFISPVCASRNDLEKLQFIFSRCGECRTVPIEQMTAGTSLASCGIAYAMRYISASAEGGARLGLQDSEQIVCQTVRGAADLISYRGLGAEAEIDRVTTPNGMTIKGLKAMEEAGFSESVIKGVTLNTTPRPRIVIKVGSNVLTRADGSLDTTRVSSIVDQIVELKALDYEVVLVTSGAVACGRSLIKEDRKLSNVEQRQLYSAVGQVRLMDLYYKLFAGYGILVGQVLTMKNNFEPGVEYDNQRSCVEVMLRSGVLPIVNENDTVSITELMFTDNDELSGLVAGMVGAQALVLLTNVDGIFDGDPSLPDSEVIRTVRPGDSLEGCISESKSKSGRGGMSSKYQVALKAAAAGVRVIIANGKLDGILPGVLTNPESTIHTEFEQRLSPPESVALTMTCRDMLAESINK